MHDSTRSAPSNTRRTARARRESGFRVLAFAALAVALLVSLVDTSGAGARSDAPDLIGPLPAAESPQDI